MGEFAILQWLIASTFFSSCRFGEYATARVSSPASVALPDSGRHPGSPMDYCLCEMAILARGEKGYWQLRKICSATGTASAIPSLE